ncbi:MAG: sensor histidine kinase [Actinomycetota bacterium]|nr:sensor histidine kinase [Actinomycetota bacterium]
MRAKANEPGLIRDFDPEREASKGSTRRIAWLAWAMYGLSLALTTRSLFLLTSNLPYPNVHSFDYWAETTVIALGCSTVGAVIASRNPETPIGWLFCTIGLAGAVLHFGAEYAIYTSLATPGSLPGAQALAWITSWTWVVAIGLFVVLALLFPSGRLPRGRWRWFGWLSMAVVAAGVILVTFSPRPLGGIVPVRNPLEVEGAKIVDGLVLALLLILGLFAVSFLFARLRRARGVERQQLKWFTYANALLFSGGIVTYIVSKAVDASWLWSLGFVLVMVGLIGIPTAVGVAILQYRLYDVDFIINRTLVYGALTASVVGIYILAVGGLGALLQLLQVPGDYIIALLGTGLVAVLFQPLRNRLQLGVNHLMYGERDEPYKVLSRLSRRIESTLAPDAVLQTIVDTVAQALKLPYTAIRLEQDGEFVTAAEHGTPAGDVVVRALTYQSERVGQLLLAPRAPGEEFTPSDWRLLDDLALQAGVAVHDAQVTADLQRSRERLVTAREEERRRLRRNLHDGLGPTLASLAHRHDVARDLLAHDPEAVDALLAELKAETREVVSDIRHLVYDLRPPALDQLGLVSAIREQAASQGLRTEEVLGQTGGPIFSMEAPKNVPPLPAAVEVAAFRITQEALTNVSRHARASTCHVRLSLDNREVRLEITDDGVGLPENCRAGVGLTSMRERAAELGGRCTVTSIQSGGTRVLAHLPLYDSED